MNRAYVDANVVLRFLTGDPPDMADRAAALFGAVERGELRLIVDTIVLAEVVWVLQSFYFDEHFDRLPGVRRRMPGGGCIKAS